MDLKNNYTEFIKLKSKELGFMSCGISKSGFLSFQVSINLVGAGRGPIHN